MELFEKIMVTIGIIVCIWIFIVIITMATTAITNSKIEAIQEKPKDRFVKIQEWKDNFVMYDKETKVQYFVFTGGVTILMDQEGKPLLYKGE